MSERLEQRRETLTHWVERDRQRLSRAIEELQSTTRETVAVGKRAARHAWAWLWAGFLVGVMLGVRAGRRQRLLTRGSSSRA